MLGPENADTLNACYNYAYQLGQQGRIKEARKCSESGLQKVPLKFWEQLILAHENTALS